MERVEIAELLETMPIEPETHLDAARVERYLREPECDPVVVFDTPEGLLLADGYHRLAAARRRGETTIAAEVREGTRGDALAYAASSAADQRGISCEEAMEAIRRAGGGEG